MITLDIPQYTGTWYTLGRNNAFYESFCEKSSAFYTQVPQGLQVLNSCYNQQDELITQIRGLATPTDNPLTFNLRFETGNAKDLYQILYTDYDNFAIIGDVKTQYLSILGRRKNLTEKERRFIIQKVDLLGFKNFTWVYW